MIDFQKELNPEQWAVVQNGDGPCLVLAGAGSGKTRTITYRVAYLLEQGVKPENILLVTFTNKAAEEMKRRVAHLANSTINSVGGRGRVSLPSPDVRQGGETPPLPNMAGGGRGRVPPPWNLPWSGTFHHIAYRILKIYAPLLGYTSQFTILDSDDSESLLKLCVKESKNGIGETKFPSASVVHAIISYAKNSEEPVGSVLENRFSQWAQLDSVIKDIAASYERRKKEANAMDFDDLLTNLLLLLRDEKVRQKFATQFEYVLVDEYQDTNKIQAHIIKQFSSIHNNVVVVGDDAQSIYSFRAADIQNILQFPKEYPRLSGGQAGAKIFKLETNYRSTKDILELANDVIANNREQYKKNLRVADIVDGGRGRVSLPSPDVGQGGGTPVVGHGKKPARPALWPQMDQQSEGNFVASQIEKLLEAGTVATEIAVLFRASHHSQMLEVELVRRGIDYDYRGGVRFFERAHIKDILAYLRILSNISDTAAWLRVLMHEEGIGPAAAQKLIAGIRALTKNSVTGGGRGRVSLPSPDVGQGGETPPLQSLDIGLAREAMSVQSLADIGQEVLGQKAQIGWNNFVQIWQVLVGAGSPRPGPTQLIDALTQSPYRDYLDNEFVDSRDRLQDIKQLALFAEKYDSLEEFLADATLQESYRTVEGEAKNTARIILSTIHQAKGLEWEAVFILNLSNGSFPSERSLRENNGLEEERRLFYVAITRAKKNLVLTYPMAGGAYGDFLAGPSSFLNEISPDLLEDHSLLSYDTTVLNDPGAGVSYVSEYEPPKRIKPGSFLQDINDL